LPTQLKQTNKKLNKLLIFDWQNTDWFLYEPYILLKYVLETQNQKTNKSYVLYFWEILLELWHKYYADALLKDCDQKMYNENNKNLSLN